MKSMKNVILAKCGVAKTFSDGKNRNMARLSYHLGHISLTWSSKPTSYWAQSSLGLTYRPKTCEKSAFPQEIAPPSLRGATERENMRFPKSGKDYHRAPQPSPHMTFVGTLTLLAALCECEKKTWFFSEMVKNDIFQV